MQNTRAPGEATVWDSPKRLWPVCVPVYADIIFFYCILAEPGVVERIGQHRKRAPG